ncbi:MAG: hypothetical protein U9O55_04760 [Patescibacteria group bacterium]|nr:hypothetical protein [Patescibacteria group bacterium]
MEKIEIYEILVNPPIWEGGEPFISFVFSRTELLKKIDSLEKSGYKTELKTTKEYKKNN